MKYGICQVVISPGRADHADAAEIKMQLVFGDLLYVLEVNNNWTQIKMAKYDYTCWIDTKHICFIEEAEFNSIYSQKEVRVKDITSSIVHIKNSEVTHLVKGCLLPNYDSGTLSFGDSKFRFLGNTNHSFETKKENIVSTALEYLNSPYLWGGNSPYGIDCSGLTQMTYLLHGIQIPRDAKDQATVGETVSFLEEATPGDLIYFDNTEGIIMHVGILLPENKIIHASGHVRIDSIDHQGIFRSDMNKYTHKLRIIKSMF
ncbi:MAG: C40 family peptidase [Flavobacteriales bacterium]